MHLYKRKFLKQSRLQIIRFLKQAWYHVCTISENNGKDFLKSLKKAVLKKLKNFNWNITKRYTPFWNLQSISEILLIAQFAILQYFFEWNIAFAILFHYCRFLLHNISILFQYWIEILQLFLCNILKIFFEIFDEFVWNSMS